MDTTRHSRPHHPKTDLPVSHPVSSLRRYVDL
jgi:hypothetical protein